MEEISCRFGGAHEDGAVNAHRCDVVQNTQHALRLSSPAASDKQMLSEWLDRSRVKLPNAQRLSHVGVLYKKSGQSTEPFSSHLHSVLGNARHRCTHSYRHAWTAYT